MARRLRKRYDETLRKSCGGTPAGALWRDACESGLARGPRKRSNETSEDAL